MGLHLFHVIVDYFICAVSILLYATNYSVTSVLVACHLQLRMVGTWELHWIVMDCGQADFMLLEVDGLLWLVKLVL